MAGITDVIALNSSASNIDIGLIENKYCDFKIDKYISKVTVNTKSGTKEYSYDNASLVKTEIKAKEIEGATVTVEYKIVITNVGEISGTVSNIVDYLPNGFTLQSSTNWAKNTNGAIVNTSFSKQKITVGESIETTLIATKNMTANTTGTYTNNVAIAGASSIAGLNDGNTNNNIANADIIISVSTGAVVYISIIIFIVFVLSLVAMYLYRSGKIKSKNLLRCYF